MSVCELSASTATVLIGTVFYVEYISTDNCKCVRLNIRKNDIYVVSSVSTNNSQKDFDF